MDYTLLMVFSMVMVIISGMFGIFGFSMGLKALIEVKALQNSTHQIQYVPVDDQIDKENERYLKEVQDKKNDWATSSDSLETQQKMYKEDIEEELPEFALDDDDKEIFSY